MLVVLCPDKQHSFEPFYLFGSCFRMLAVILVSDFVVVVVDTNTVKTFEKS